MTTFARSKLTPFPDADDCLRAGRIRVRGVRALSCSLLKVCSGGLGVDVNAGSDCCGVGTIKRMLSKDVLSDALDGESGRLLYALLTECPAPCPGVHSLLTLILGTVEPGRLESVSRIPSMSSTPSPLTLAPSIPCSGVRLPLELGL
eukprot:3937383-Rhodomonas_salina.1